MRQPASTEPLHPTAQSLTAPPGGLSSYPPLERWEEAERFARESVEVARKIAGGEHLKCASALTFLGEALHNLGRLE